MRAFLITLILSLCLALPLQAGLSVSGTWRTEDSPILINQDAFVPEGHVLTVEPGVNVRFADNTGLEVLGQINTEGTEKYPVVFEGNAPGVIWEGITITGSDEGQTSSLIYTDISDAEIGIQADGGVLHMTHCSVKANLYALQLDNDAYARLRGCTLSVFTTVSEAKTVYTYDSVVELHDCDISLQIPQSTPTPAGGAVHMYLSTGEIDSCDIQVSTRTGANGVRLIACYNNVDIRRSSIYVERTNGLADRSSSAIYASHTDLNELDRMTLHLVADGGSIYGVQVTQGSDIRMINSIVAVTEPVFGTDRMAAYVDPNSSNSSVYFAYMDVYQMQLSNDTPYFEYDPESLIAADPRWESPGLHNYHLMADSPCINMGSPNSEPDPDGTLPDLGRHIFVGTSAPEPEPVVARGFELSPAWPNPFNAATRVRFTLDQPAVVRARVQNLLGRTVAELADSRFSAGSHTLSWQVDRSAGISSGMYLLHVSADGAVRSQRLVLLK